MNIEDKILFNEIKNHNLKVYESLFSSYYPQLIRFAEGYIFDRQECEDIVQNLFIYFWENADRIDIDNSLKGYLFQSVKNRCMNYLRDLQIHDRHNLLYVEALLNQSNYIELEDPEIYIQIHEAIERLPQRMGEIIRLKFLQGKKIEEIASIERISENTVKTQLLRAKNTLRNLLIETTSIKFFF